MALIMFQNKVGRVKVLQAALGLSEQVRGHSSDCCSVTVTQAQCCSPPLQRHISPQGTCLQPHGLTCCSS